MMNPSNCIMTDTSEFGNIVATARNAFYSGRMRNVDYRIKQLNQLYRMICENKERFESALMQDAGKTKYEAGCEIQSVRINVCYTKSKVKKWVKPIHVQKNCINIADELFIQKEPYGVVLVIGPWNFPLIPMLVCATGAIAAGNCVIMKPSEMTPRTAGILKEQIHRYLDKECFHIVTGGPAETTRLLKERFDYIAFTGTPKVGKIIQQMANENMTPVVLELAGKNPSYMDDSVNIEVACRRLLWFKFFNTGQVCIAPDYLLCSKELENMLVPVMKKILREFYGENPEYSQDYGRIFSDKHFSRLCSLIKTADIVIGGETNVKTRYMAPTVITNVKLSDPIMDDEIFGPILPIVTVNSADEAIVIINSRDKALSLSVFSTKKDVIKKFLENTSSGGICINDSFGSLLAETLPHSGVGKSGMGYIRGQFSFDTFSHQKSVIHRNNIMIPEEILSNRYPPYTKLKFKVLEDIFHRLPQLPHISIGLTLFLGLGAAMICYQVILLIIRV